MANIKEPIGSGMSQSIFPSSEDNWTDEQTQWKSYFVSHLGHQLNWFTNHVLELEGNLSPLEKHLGSLLALLRQSHIHAATHAEAVDLISHLHPWPLRWESGDAWENEIRFAIQHFETTSQSQRLLKFKIFLAEHLQSSGRLEESRQTSKDALQLARSLHDYLHLTKAGQVLISNLALLGEAQEAQTRLNQLTDELEHWTPEPEEHQKTVAKAYLALPKMDILRNNGQPFEAVKIATQVLHKLEDAQEVDPELIISIFKVRGTLRWVYGDYPGAAQDLEKAILLLSREGDKLQETFTRSELGVVYLSMSNFDQAEKVFRESIQTCERLNARWKMISDIGNLAVVFLSRGLLQQSLTYVNRQMDLAERANHNPEYYRALSNRGSINLYLKRFSLAIKDILQSLKWYQSQNNHAAVIAEQFELGMCYEGLGNSNRGQVIIEESYQAMQALNIPNLHIFGRRCLANYSSPERAKILLYQAMLLAQKYSRRLDEAGCLLTLSSLSNNQTQKQNYWNDGKSILQEIGATTWLDGTPFNKPPLIFMSL